MIYVQLFLTFLKIGAFTFGGGYAMLPLIQEAVTANGWLDAGALIDFIAVSESTPGPFAVNIATYVGSELGGVPGAVCATLGVTLPSFVIILFVANRYEKYKRSRLVQGCMSGLKPAVVGLIAAAVLSMAKTVFFHEENALASLTTPAALSSLCIFAAALVLVFRKVHPILLICLAAAAGIACGYLL